MHKFVRCVAASLFNGGEREAATHLGGGGTGGPGSTL